MLQTYPNLREVPLMCWSLGSEQTAELQILVILHLLQCSTDSPSAEKRHFQQLRK